MRSLLRQGLVWTLTIALVMAGLPLAHAQNCATLHPAPVQQHHHAMQHEMNHDMAMPLGAADNDAALIHAPTPQHHDSQAPLCKCLNCSSLCAAFVAPIPTMAALQRRVGAIVYATMAVAQNETAIFIDPGIPIAA